MPDPASTSGGFRAEPVHPPLARPSPSQPVAAAPLLLRELRPAGCAEIAAWPGRVAEVTAALRALCGVELPARSGRFALGSLCLAAATAPGRWLLLADETDPVGPLRGRVAAADAAIVDLGHSRSGLRIAGAPAAELLSKGVDIDLHPEAFPPGAVAQTVVHHIGVTMLRRAPDVFDLYVYRSLAVDFADWLQAAGAEYGMAVAPPEPGCLALA